MFFEPFWFLFRILDKFHKSMSGVLFFQLLSCASFFALTLFSLNKADTIESQVFIDIQNISMYLVLCFVYSHYSENISAKSVKLADVIYCTNWYEMPLEEQKTIILMIMRSQKEYRFDGYGMVHCSLANFWTVCGTLLNCSDINFSMEHCSFQIVRASISYYLVVRNLV